MGTRIVWKFVAAFVLLILGSVFILNFFVSIKLNDYLESTISERLKSNAILSARLMENTILLPGRVQYKARELGALLGVRVTVIDARGKVLGDSDQSSENMGPHADRPEVVDALSSGMGESVRYSKTLGYSMKYVAVAVVGQGPEAEGVVRLSMPLSELDVRVKSIYRIVLNGGFVAVGFVIVMGFIVSRIVMSPITEMTEVARGITDGDFSRRLRVRGHDEFAVLASTLNSMSEELEFRMRRLKEANRTKTELVANVSHELKTPLTSILGYIETLEHGALDDRLNARRFLGIIRKHAEGLGNTVEDLLKLSELEFSMRGRLEPEQFDMLLLMDDIIAGFGPAVARKGQSLLSEHEGGHEGEGFMLMGDRLKIEQAIVNMVDNAIKYTPEGGEVRVVVRGDARDMEVSVSDTGVGISPEHIERVFERFYRVDKARSRSLGGTGLGLAIVKHTVLLHGGTVDIKSEPGVGTTITIRLPH